MNFKNINFHSAKFAFVTIVFCLVFSIVFLLGSSLAFFSDINNVEKEVKSGKIDLLVHDVLIEKADVIDQDDSNDSYSDSVPTWITGDVNTLKWTVTNTGVSAIKLMNTLQIAWDVDNTEDLNEAGVVYIYPSTMSDDLIRSDITSNNGSLAIINSSKNDLEQFNFSNGNSRKGFTFTLEDYASQVSLNSSLANGQSISLSTESNHTYYLKIVFGVKTGVGQDISYFNKFEGKNLKVEINTGANTVNESTWSKDTSHFIMLNNAHVDPNASIFTMYDHTPPAFTITPTTESISLGSTYNVMTGVSAIDVVDGNVTNNVTTVTNLNTNIIGTYIITYTVKDSSNNESTATRTITIVEPVIEPANAPLLSDNMVPIKWSSNTWVKADETNPDNNLWYDYDNQMWGNAVTVTEATRSTYQNAPIGTEVLEDDILTYMVWIPRYEYKYTNLGTAYAGGTQIEPGAISVNFISGKSTTSTTDYKVHPAFTFGNQELTGFWVGKFETGYYGATSTANAEQDVTINNKIIIKPNVYTWRSIKLEKMFTNTINMDDSQNIYGFSANKVDTHVMKNSEWGAVTYLSQSTYGKYGNSDYTGENKEVYKNDSSGYLTGKSCGGPGSTSGTCSTFIANGTYSYSDDKNGTGASTTGNIYGIYDMSGGTWEYVMGNLNDTMGSSGFDSAWFTSNTKYYDKYTATTAITACLGGVCYGHAISGEASGWYSDIAGFLTSENPWLIRGGYARSPSNAGVFGFDYMTGSISSAASFRIVLTQ